MALNEKNFYTLLTEQAAARPGHPAIVLGSAIMTYAVLIETIDHIASTLIAAGLRKGMKAALWGLPNPMWIPAYFGIIHAGGIAVIMNANLSVAEAEPLFTFADCEFMLFGGSHDIEGNADEAEMLAAAMHIPADHAFSLLDTDFSAAEPCECSGLDTQVRDDAFVIFTSGTTSFPKAVLLSQFSYINEMDNVNAAIHSIRGRKAAIAAPLFHVYGLMSALMYLITGDTIYLPKRIKADTIAELVERYTLTDIFSIPLIFQRIVDSPDLTEKVAPSARMCFIAGSYTSPVQLMRFESSISHATFINLYGMTETSSGYVLTRPEDAPPLRYNTVGRVIDGVEACVWSEDRGILPPGETGEVLTRGYHIKNSYYKLPPEKQGVDADGWFHSGDLGVFDEDGYLRIVGRIKDLIIKGGENIAPAEIEGVIADAPGVRECRVFGFRDPLYGEDLSACVTVTQDYLYDEEQLRQNLLRKLGSYKTPRYFFVYDEFPSNASGKINQRALHADMLRRLRLIELRAELNHGLEVASLVMKHHPFSIRPTAAMAAGYAEMFRFDSRKTAGIRESVEKMLRFILDASSSDEGEISVRILCHEHHLRISFRDSCSSLPPEGEARQQLVEAITLRSVDAYDMKPNPDGQTVYSLDYIYSHSFDIRGFLLEQERTHISQP